MRTLDHEMKGNGETDIYLRPLDRSRRWSIGPWRNTNTKQILAEKGVNFGARNRCGEFTNYIGETVRRWDTPIPMAGLEISQRFLWLKSSMSDARSNVKTCILAEEVEPFRFAPWVHALILGCSECFGPKTAELWVKLSNFRAQLYASLGSGGWKIPAAAGCAFSFILRKTNNI